MEILKVNYEIGNKCYAQIQGAVRECIFLGTTGIKQDNGFVASYYHLNVAGIGERYVEFDRFGQFDDWYHASKCVTPLYTTIEDCVARKNPITAQYGATDNLYNEKFMQPFFKNCKVGNCGGIITGWIFDGVRPIQVFVTLTSAEYKIDENGFSMVGIPKAYGFVDNISRIPSAEQRNAKVYKSYEDCKADNAPQVVTF